MKRLSIILILTLLSSLRLQATELVQSFKSPVFTSIGYSSHVITLENLTYGRAVTLKDKVSAAQSAAEAKAMNTPINQFILNLQARIYSQIAAQVKTQLFAGDNTSGSFEMPGGALVNWTVDLGIATLNIFDPTNNATTTIKIPVGTLILAGGGA
jgi:hypothetical protein